MKTIRNISWCFLSAWFAGEAAPHKGTQPGPRAALRWWQHLSLRKAFLSPCEAQRKVYFLLKCGRIPSCLPQKELLFISATLTAALSVTLALRQVKAFFHHILWLCICFQNTCGTSTDLSRESARGSIKAGALEVVHLQWQQAGGEGWEFPSKGSSAQLVLVHLAVSAQPGAYEPTPTSLGLAWRGKEAVCLNIQLQHRSSLCLCWLRAGLGTSWGWRCVVTEGIQHIKIH